MEPSTPGTPVPVGSEVPPVKGPIDWEFERRTFGDLLAQFDGEPLENPAWPGFSRERLTPILMSMSVSAYMDRAGTFELIVRDGQVRSVHRDGQRRFDCVFDHNGRRYRFMTGEFPVYDEWLELVRAQSVREMQNRATPVSAQDPPYSEDFLRRASEFGHSAFALR